jgi:hypothetical protein
MKPLWHGWWESLWHDPTSVARWARAFANGAATTMVLLVSSDPDHWTTRGWVIRSGAVVAAGVAGLVKSGDKNEPAP